MAKKMLLLDCDGVIFNSNELIDQCVQKIYFCASDKYCKYLNDLASKLQSEIDQLNMERPNDSELKKSKERERQAVKELINDHFYAKDMVLEEVLPEYKDRIDFMMRDVPSYYKVTNIVKELYRPSEIAIKSLNRRSIL